ncbi:MAG: hypothetical protein Q7T71_18095, partial [Herbiconiux sp.]|nr:hypothetical protein [Herbiconiux sp.]
MDHFTSTENARPWWADVAHLRDDAGHATASSVTSSARREQAPVRDRPRRAAESERPARSHARPR